MVYFPSLPLIVKSEMKQQEQQLCSQPGMVDDAIMYQHARSLNSDEVSSNLQKGSLYTKATTATQQKYPATIKVEGIQPQAMANGHVNGSEGGGGNAKSRTNSKSPKQQFKCEQCDMVFASKSAHSSHKKSHATKDTTSYAPSTIVPGEVTASSTSVPQLTLTNNVGGDPYQCNVCQKTFAVPARLIRHYRTHTGERPFKCEFCDKMFSVKENLQVHRRIHTKERPYKCEVCGRAFEHSGKLHRHMRIHTGERPHKCTVCGKTFIQSGQLVIHMRTHTGEKPYKCPVEGCGKGFTCSKQLKVHSRTHTGEKPYHCDICSRDFGYNHVLKLHKVQHYGSKCYKCTICDETFKSKKEMEAHIKGHANEIPDDEESASNSHTSASSSTSTEEVLVYSPNGVANIKDEIMMPSSSATSIILETEQIANSEGYAMQAPSPNLKPDMVPHSRPSEEEMIYNHSYRENLEASSYAGMNPQTMINPVLLAAASIASRKVEESANANNGDLSAASSTVVSDRDYNSMEANERYYKSVESNNTNTRETENKNGHFEFGAMNLHQQKTFFTPAPVPEYRSALRHNDIVRQVEAAIVGAGFSPPRSSSTESPERSSSPESDTMMMADRDIMTLPLRKRKLYMSDNQSKDVQKVIRMNTVIQFARAS